VVQPFDIGWKSPTIFGIYLYLVTCKTRTGSLVYWYCNCPIYPQVNDWKKSTSSNLQSTPKDCQAASTSGPASCLNSFKLKKDPLYCTVLYDKPRPSITGAGENEWAYAGYSIVNESTYNSVQSTVHKTQPGSDANDSQATRRVRQWWYTTMIWSQSWENTRESKPSLGKILLYLAIAIRHLRLYLRST
jgi:hypothetical protein